MDNYSDLFNDEMNSLELRLIYIGALHQCATEEDKKVLLDVYKTFSDKAFTREMLQKDILTSY